MIIAHDLGTSGVKSSLHDEDGRLLATEGAAYPTDWSADGRAEQNPDDWWTAVVATTRRLVCRAAALGGRVEALGLSGQMMGAVLLDRAGSPVRPAMIWADRRSAPAAARLSEAVGAQRAYAITGHRIDSAYTLPKAMWVREHEPATWRLVRHVCLAKDEVVRRLTGEIVTDPSDASGTDALDQAHGRWSAEILDAAGIGAEVLPPILPSTTVVGGVRSMPADGLGLRSGTPVVLGGGDGAIASVGAGVLSPADPAYLCLGTSAWIAAAGDLPLHDPARRTFTFTHVVPGRYLPMATMQTAGAALDWVVHVLRPEAGPDDVRDLINAASRVEAARDGLFFLPYLAGERSPWWSPSARGVFVGLTPRHDQRHLVRAVLEGIAFNLRLCLDALGDAGVRIARLRAIGGGSTSAVWLRILADTLGVPISRRTQPASATSIGAAITTLVGTGRLESFDAAEGIVGEDGPTVEPDPAHADTADLVGRFTEAWRAAEPWFTSEREDS